MNSPSTALTANPSSELQANVGTSGIEHELAGYVPHLRRMGEQLKYTSRQIEESVVGVCGSFQDIALRAKATVDQAKTFLSQGDRNATGTKSFDTLLATCSQTMVKLLESSEEATQISRRAIERVQKIDKTSEEVTATLQKLERIAVENKMLAMNARIEAAHAGELGAGFAVVAVEVVSQTEKTKEITARVSELINDLRALAESTVADLKSMEATDRQRMQQCRKDVDHSIEHLQATHGEMTEMLTAMMEQSALLAGDIGNAVRGMQFQDRTKQQIAHVIDDLSTLHGKLADRFGEGVSKSASEGFSEFTMYEERLIAGTALEESAAGEVELF